MNITVSQNTKLIIIAGQYCYKKVSRYISLPMLLAVCESTITNLHQVPALNIKIFTRVHKSDWYKQACQRMKEIIAFYLLISTVGLGVTLTAGAYSQNDYSKLVDALLNGRVLSMQNDISQYKLTTKTDPSNEKEESIAEVQAIFNVMAQVDLERAKLKNSDAFIQKFWSGLIKSLWKRGKNYLIKNLCSKEQAMKALLQELTNEEMGMDDNSNSKDDDDDVRAQLQVLFNALQEVKANSIREGNTAKAEDLGDRIKSFAKNLVC